MYARIESNTVVEQDSGEHSGVPGWVAVPAADVGKALVYDSDTGSVRAKTDAEETAEFNTNVLDGAWYQLRSVRDAFLKETDSCLVSDRPETENMPEYREYLRDLPATYDDTSILSQTPVMDFAAYVASL